MNALQVKEILGMRALMKKKKGENGRENGEKKRRKRGKKGRKKEGNEISIGMNAY